MTTPLSQRRTAVVTGSTSGIGKAIALEFARHDYDVFVHGATNSAGLDETLQACAALSPSPVGKFHGCLVDLSQPSGPGKLFYEVSQWTTDIAVWVNAAGADVLTRSKREASFLSKLELLWLVDVRATIELSRLTAEQMRAQESTMKGAIINIGWDQAERGMSGDSGQYFSAVKSAVMAFTRSFAMTVGPQVRANCLAPGWIKTAWGDTAPREWSDRAVGESAMARWGQPSDIAQAAVWLASSAAEFINGQVIAINGGWKPNYP